MVNSLDFTKRLEKILAYYALSASALAEEIDFNRSTISHLLSGRNKPSLEFVMKLYQKFPELDIDWLLFGKGVFPKASDTNKEESTLYRASSRETVPSDLFTGHHPQPAVAQAPNAEKEIERIVIFYRDGTFNSYEN